MCVQKFSKNILGRDFVVGDIHGCYDLLDQALGRVAFDETKDRLFFCGGFDRPWGRVCGLFKLSQKQWFHAVHGNHEDMFIKSIKDGEHLTPHESILTCMNGMGWIARTSEETLNKIKKDF